MYFINQSKQDVDSTVHVLPTSEEEDQTSEVGEVGDNNVRPITPIPNETRTDEEGSIQTQENIYHQIFENMRRDKMIPRESKHNRTVCSPSDADEVENTQSFTVPDIEEENILEENFRLKERIKILEQCCQMLFMSSKLKDEEINRKPNLQAKHDEDMKKIKDDYAILEEELEKSKKETRDLNEEGKDKEKKIKELEEDYRDVHEFGRLAVQSEMEETKKQKDENTRLRKGMEDEIARLEHEKSILVHDVKECKDLQICRVCWDRIKQIVLLPCGHFCICQKCFVEYNFECPICRIEITGHVKGFNS